MKKLLVVLLALMMVFSFAACGGDDQAQGGDDQLVAESSDGSEADGTADDQNDDQGADIDKEGWLATKTGKFYSQFEDKMYMEYGMEVEGNYMTVISATQGEKTYTETKLDGAVISATLQDEEYIYNIDHTNKMILKIALEGAFDTSADVLLTEDDLNPADVTNGTRTIDGKTYETEEWTVEGAKSIFCFDGDDLKYMIGVMDGEEMVMKIESYSNKVDSKLFEIPAGYEVMEY